MTSLQLFPHTEGHFSSHYYLFYFILQPFSFSFCSIFSQTTIFSCSLSNINLDHPVRPHNHFFLYSLPSFSLLLYFLGCCSLRIYSVYVLALTTTFYSLFRPFPSFLIYFLGQCSLRILFSTFLPTQPLLILSSIRFLLL